MKHLHIVAAKVWGGGEQYVYNLCAEFTRRGDEMYVVVDETQIEIAARYEDVAKVILVDLRGILGLAAYPKITGILEQEQIDTLNCHSGSKALLCALLKKAVPAVKFVMFRHNLLPNKGDMYHNWLQGKVDEFVCVSKAVYDLQVATAKAKEKFNLVYSGIDPARFPDKLSTAELDIFTVGYAGRLTENKGILLLVQVIKELKNEGLKIKLLLSGTPEGEFLKTLDKEVEVLDLKNEVKNLGRNNDMNDFYRNLDVFVLPSIVKEAFGLVLCEAMYCKVPVISTTSGAQGEIITDKENGLLVPANDLDGLKVALKGLAADKALQSKLAVNGFATVEEKFTIKRCIDDLIKVYKK